MIRPSVIPSVLSRNAGRTLRLLPALALFLWCALSPAPLPANTQATVQDTVPFSPPASITVVLDNDYPPYIFVKADGQPQGILADSWKLWSHKTGVPVILKPMPWAQAQKAIRDGTADIIDTLFKNEAREREYIFSKPYATIDVPIFVHKDLGGINDIASLRGFTVGVKRGDASADFLKNHGIDTLRAFDGYEALIKAAEDGRIKVFTVDKPPALYHLYKAGISRDFRLAFTLYSGQFHRAAAVGREPLLQFVESGFGRITPAEREAIDHRWLGVPLLSPEDLHLLFWGLGLVAALALILLGINAVLRRRVRRQTEKLNQLLDAVRASEERYRELIHNANTIIVRLDIEGRVTFINESGQRFFGYSLEEMLGRAPGERIDLPDDAQGETTWKDLISRIRDTPEGNLSFDRKHRRRNGEAAWIAWSLQVLRTPTGEPSEVLCVGHDITERRRAEEALRASEERYTLVSRGANDGLWDWDLRTNTVYFSERYLNILGYSAGELGHTADAWSNRLHPEDAEAVIRENKRCADGLVDNFAVEYRMRHKDGSYRWILGRGASLKDASGRVIRMAGTHTDMTRRKQAEEALRESQDQLAKIFRLSPVGLGISTRRGGRIIDINEAGAGMFGYSKTEVIGHTALELGLWHHPEERQEILNEMTRNGSVVNREVSLRHQNGSTIIVLFSVVPNQAYGEPCLLSVLVDITERKALEQALRRSKDAADAANRTKSDFLSTISHEIRTPMTTILGMVDILARTELSAEQSQALHTIENAGTALLDLLSDILDFSRIESGGMVLEERPCDINDLAGKVADMMRPDALRKDLTLRFIPDPHIPPRLWCCPERLRQVLLNLLGNAIKFTPKGDVELEVSHTPSTEGGGPRLRLIVRDTGIGIAPDKQRSIFDRFTQVNSSASRTFGGVGLGLAICKRLVDMMGGHIQVASTVGQGSTFSVTLPLRQATASEAVNTIRAGRRLPIRPAAVLLVEDSPSTSEVIRLMLEDSPFETHWAPSGQAALELFHGTPFDIIVMDVEMPGMDGCQTAEALRQAERELGRPRTPIIALSAHASEEHRQRCLAAGCDDYQIKPIPKARLLDVLETWMALREQ